MSENENALHESLELYKSQLKNIKSALEIASDEQKPDLQQIEKDLEEIIQLTQASLLNTTDTDVCEEGETSIQHEQSNLENELGALEGVKCKVPFQYEWGGLGFHNAIILGTEIDEDDGTVHINVVFMHPTSKKMKPCPYYLEGHCKYSDETCHYSHGYSVQLDQVQNYKDPDYNQITEGSTVLAKYKDELWYRGCVEDIIKDTEFSVKFLHNNDVLLLNLHSIFPLEENESDDSSGNEDDGEDVTFAPRSIETLDLIAHHDPSSFGHWEKHTKGIGGKLMTKMGYVYGSGLGKEGEGRIEPVQAVVFPPGRSLDRCMELREKAGNEDLLSVEKRLERQKAKEERRLRQLATATEREASVFDFINSKLASKKTQDDGKSSSTRPKMANLSGLSHEKLNVQSLQISEDIRKAERDIAHTKLSLQRQSARGDLASVAQIRTRLAEKEKDLERLRSSDRTIANEQKQRKSSSKLTIF